MALFKKKEKKVTTYDGSTGQKLEGEAPAKIPELEVPRPPAEEENPAPTLEDLSDLVEVAFERGFYAGINTSINILKDARNDVLRRQKGV